MRYDGHFRLAHELGKHLHEVMGWTGPMTGRQFDAWQEWMEMEWDRPDRNDHYIMKLIDVVKHIIDGKSGDFGKEKISFETKGKKKLSKRQRDQMIAASKSRTRNVLHGVTKK